MTEQINSKSTHPDMQSGSTIATRIVMMMNNTPILPHNHKQHPLTYNPTPKSTKISPSDHPLLRSTPN